MKSIVLILDAFPCSLIECQQAPTEQLDEYLRVVLLEDGETVHNAFFDRRFQEVSDES